MRLPKHLSSLTIEHNDNTVCYETVEQHIPNDDRLTDNDSRSSLEDKENAIETNSLWTMQVYPEWPGTFYFLAASTLKGLLEFAEKTFECEEYE